MGAWGYGPFENDDAGDWIWGLENASDFDVVQAAFQTVVDSSEYADAPSCSEAIAAGEVVAASLGRPLGGLPEEVPRWAPENRDVPAEVVSACRLALAAIESRSELRDLWEEAAELDAWLQTIRDLNARIEVS